MISPLIKWEHEKDWYVIQKGRHHETVLFEGKVFVQPREKEWNYITGHVVDGKFWYK